MPHVVLAGTVDLREWAEAFEPIVLRRNGVVLRAERVYLESSHRSALVDGLTVESGRKQSFYVKVALHDRGSCTVRIDPITHPDRSPGVRELVGSVAASLLDRSPDARVARSNVVVPSCPRGAGAPQADSNE